jgi:hypothetical protein
MGQGGKTQRINLGIYGHRTETSLSFAGIERPDCNIFVGKINPTDTILKPIGRYIHRMKEHRLRKQIIQWLLTRKRDGSRLETFC